MITFILSEHQLRRLIVGGVRDAMKTHPEYFTPRGRAGALDGIAKRVHGTFVSFAAQSAEGREPAATGAFAALDLG